MYSLSLQRRFIAQHYLIGGDWGPENELHSHPFCLQVNIQGSQLDQHGYLIDLVDLETQLDVLLDRFRDKTLNELPEFDGLNPSIEHFSRIVCHALVKQIKDQSLQSVEVRIWEDEEAWASFRQEF